MPLPIENLDDKTFEELVKEAVSRIPIYAPEWTDHNIHDPGITFIELFAWLAEMQMYRLNRITDRSYRKFLKLMGIPKLKPARAAEVDVSFSLCNQQPTLVKAGTPVAARDPISGEDIIFETKQNIEVVPTNLQKVLSWKEGVFTDNTEANKNENVFYYAFGESPKTGDRLYLGFDRSLENEETTMAFYLYEEDSSDEKLEMLPSSTLSWEYCKGGNWRKDESGVKLDAAKKEIGDEMHLSKSGKVRIKVTGAMGRVEIEESNLFWLRCTILEAGYEIQPKIDSIHLNTVSAIHGVSFLAEKNCTECKFSGSGLPDFYLDLEYTPVIERTLEVKVEEDTWIEVEDFDASKPGDRHYTVDLATGRVSFGDGINGKIPPKAPKEEDNITVSYRSGGGVRGNVEPHAINRVLGKLAKKVTVDNKKAAFGGDDAETLKDAKHRARKDLKTVYRAVTSVDYEHLAMSTPGLRVARVKAIPRYHRSQGKEKEVPGIVSVIVVPYSPYAKPEPSGGFLKTVYRHLDKHRLLTTELFVIRPEYIEVSVDATVVIKPKYVKSTVEENVRTELKENFLNPVKGGVDRKGWPFGRSAYISEIYEIIDRVDGVDYVKSLVLKKKDGEWQASDIDIPAHGLVYSGTHKIKAKEVKEDFHG